jgi:hypothetical protein
VRIWRAFLIAVFLGAPCAAAETQAHLVEIVAAGEAESVTLLEERSRSLLRDYPIRLEWSVRTDFRPRDVFAAGEHAALARIWLDLRQGTQAVLYVVDDAHDRFLVRVVPLDAGYDEVACESVGTIVQSSVEALLAGATVGVTRQAAEAQVSELEGSEPAAAQPEPAKPPPARAPAPEPRGRRYRLSVDLSYRGQLLQDGPEILHGPELGASLTRPDPPLSLTGFAALGYRLPLSWDEQGVGLQMEGFGLRAGPGLGWRLGRPIHLRLLGVLGLDVLEVDPVSTDPLAAATDPFWILVPMLGAAAEIELRLFGPLSLWASAGAEVDLAGHHFDVLEDGQPVTVLQAWTVQPAVRLGVRLWP